MQANNGTKSQIKEDNVRNQKTKQTDRQTTKTLFENLV